MASKLFTRGEQMCLRKFWRNKWVARLLIPPLFPLVFSINFGVAMWKEFMEHIFDFTIVAKVWKAWEVPEDGL